MPGAFLTDVETRKREPVDVHLREQGVEGFTGEIRADKAGADQLEIAAEFSDRSVMQGFAGLCIWRARRKSIGRRAPAGIRQLIVPQLREAEPFQHEAELQSVGLQAIAGRAFLIDLGEPQSVHFERLQQRCTHLTPLHGDAQLVTQVLDRVDVAVQHQLTLVTSGAPGDVGGDGRVSVAVGSDPGAKGAERRRRQLHIRVAA